MNKKEKFEIGSVIKNDRIDAVAAPYKVIHDADMNMVRTISQRLVTEKDGFFEAVLEIHPELEGYVLSLNHKDSSITIMRKDI